MFPPIEPDEIIRDGESLRLGDQTMTARLTPGHTRGTTTWITKITDGPGTYNVVFVGSQSSLDYKFIGQESYPGIAADFQRSFALLEGLPCDIFLGSHGSFFDLAEKRKLFMRGDTNAFVDPTGYHRYLRKAEEDYRRKLDQQRDEVTGTQ